MNKIGYYVHHHGDGHRQRALAIAEQAPEYFTLIGTRLKGRTENIECLDLPDDSTIVTRENTKHLKATHYTPLHHKGIKERTYQIARWIAQTDPPLIIVDVSVEIALLARLCSTPTVYVRLSGERFDCAHLEAFRSAEAILCPFHPLLEHKKTPKWVRKKSFYFSGLTSKPVKHNTIKHYIVVVLGAGGHEVTVKQLIDMAEQLENWRIDVIGPVKAEEKLPENLRILGWVDNAQKFITNANLIIGPAGDGLIAEVMAHGKPYICLPQKRPFNEQITKAQELERLGTALVIKKWPKNWPKIIKKVLKSGGLMGFLHNEAAAAQAADFLLTLAYGQKLTSKKNV